MNRRSFFKNVGAIALAMGIGLPRLNIGSVKRQPQLVTYWQQVDRCTRCVDDEYLRALHNLNIEAIKMNLGHGESRPLGEGDPQFIKTFFYGEPIKES